MRRASRRVDAPPPMVSLPLQPQPRRMMAGETRRRARLAHEQGIIRASKESFVQVATTRARKDSAVQLEMGRGALSPSVPLSVVKVEVGRGGGATEASWSASPLAVSPARGRAKEGRPHWTLERARRAAFRAQSKRRCCGRNKVRKGNGTRQTGGHQRAVAAEDMPASC